MNQNPFSLEERIRNIEKALLSFMFFTVTSFSLATPDRITQMYGSNGIIVFLIIFLASIILKIYYFFFVSLSVISDTSNQTIKCIVKHKKASAVLIEVFLIAIIVFAFYYKFDVTANDIMVIIGTIILGYLILNFNKISKDICSLIAKAECGDEEENTQGNK
jgi:phosphate/sulfate permease